MREGILRHSRDHGNGHKNHWQHYRKKSQINFLPLLNCFYDLTQSFETCVMKMNIVLLDYVTTHLTRLLAIVILFPAWKQNLNYFTSLSKLWQNDLKINKIDRGFQFHWYLSVSDAYSDVITRRCSLSFGFHNCTWAFPFAWAIVLEMRQSKKFIHEFIFMSHR